MMEIGVKTHRYPKTRLRTNFISVPRLAIDALSVAIAEMFQDRNAPAGVTITAE